MTGTTPADWPTLDTVTLRALDAAGATIAEERHEYGEADVLQLRADLHALLARTGAARAEAVVAHSVERLAVVVEAGDPALN